MKKTIIPSLSLAILGILAVPVIAVMISMIFLFIKDIQSLIIEYLNNPDFLKLIRKVFSDLFCIACFIVVLGVGIYNFVELPLFGGRPFTFSGEIIQSGFFKRKKYYKKDITGIGIAPSICGNLYHNGESENLGIYIAFGNYKKSDLRDYGIINVWEAAEFCKIWPSAVNLTNKIFAKMRLPDCSKIQPLDGLLWMTYTEDNMRFLKEWMGDRFEEVV